MAGSRYSSTTDLPGKKGYGFPPLLICPDEARAMKLESISRTYLTLPLYLTPEKIYRIFPCLSTDRPLFLQFSEDIIDADRLWRIDAIWSFIGGIEGKDEVFNVTGL